MTEMYGPTDSSIPAWTPPAEVSPIAPSDPPAPGTPPPSTARPTYGPPPGSSTPTHRSWQPGIMPLRPMTFGDFLSYPFKAIRYNKAVVVGGPLVSYLAVALAMGVALWMLFEDIGTELFSYDYYDYAATPAPIPGPRGETIAALVLAGILLLLSEVISRAIIAPGVARAVLGERISLGTAWTLLRARLGPLLGLYGLATLAMLVPTIIFVALYALALTDSSGAAALLLLFVGFPLMAVVAIVYNIFIGIAVPVIVLERGRVGAAFGRTFRLIKGRFWWTVLITFVVGLLVGIASSILLNAVQVIGMLAVFALPDSTRLAVGIYAIAITLSYVVSLVLQTSFMGSAFNFIYIDLRIRHEGFDTDLAEAAEARARR